jgi:hypothetical protein
MATVNMLSSMLEDIEIQLNEIITLANLENKSPPSQVAYLIGKAAGTLGAARVMNDRLSKQKEGK